MTDQTNSNSACGEINPQPIPLQVEEKSHYSDSYSRENNETPSFAQTSSSDRSASSAQNPNIDVDEASKAAVRFSNHVNQTTSRSAPIGTRGSLYSQEERRRRRSGCESAQSLGSPVSPVKGSMSSAVNVEGSVVPDRSTGHEADSPVSHGLSVRRRSPAGSPSVPDEVPFHRENLEEEENRQRGPKCSGGTPRALKADQSVADKSSLTTLQRTAGASTPPGREQETLPREGSQDSGPGDDAASSAVQEPLSATRQKISDCRPGTYEPSSISGDTNSEECRIYCNLSSLNGCGNEVPQSLSGTMGSASESSGGGMYEVDGITTPAGRLSFHAPGEGSKIDTTAPQRNQQRILNRESPTRHALGHIGSLRNSSSRIACALSPAEGGPCKKCPHDLKVLCRLVASHHGHPPVKSVVSFTVDGCQYKFNVIENLDVGQNVRCLVLKRHASACRDNRFASTKTTHRTSQLNGADAVFREGEPFDDKHTVFAFNWFSPRGIYDYVTLGLRMITSRAADNYFGMCGQFYMRKAEEFLWNPSIRGLIREIRTGTGERLSNTNNITVTGFSMGGAIAHAFAYLLVEECRLTAPIRVVGIGSNRPGTRKFTDWFNHNLMPNSLNVLLACEEENEPAVIGPTLLCSVNGPSVLPSICSSSSLVGSSPDSIVKLLTYDPVTRTPQIADGFDIHPRAHILLQAHGTLMPIGPNEEAWLRARDEEYEISTFGAIMNTIRRGYPFPGDFHRLWSKLHSVFRYYEGMSGVGEN